MLDQYHLQEEGMDVLVMLEENPDHSAVLAHVNSIPSPLASAERSSRDIVTLYGAPSPESVALALAAAVECHRSSEAKIEAIRHLGAWPERGAIGDAAWRDSRPTPCGVWPVDSASRGWTLDARLAGGRASSDHCLDRTDRRAHCPRLCPNRIASRSDT